VAPTAKDNLSRQERRDVDERLDRTLRRRLQSDGCGLLPAAPSAMVFRGEISRELGEAAIGRLEDVDVEPRHPCGLVDRAWRIAKENGWAKTYDAEYLALAEILGCRLVTIDGPLWRRSRHLSFVVTPSKLQPKADGPRTDPAA
jgi:hypothetical protein